MPIEDGGSHIIENLLTLCQACHAAAHKDRKAPRLYFEAPYSFDTDRFQAFIDHFRDHPRWQYDSSRERWYVPAGDWWALAEDLKDELVLNGLLKREGFDR